MKETKFKAMNRDTGEMFDVAELTVRDDGLWDRTPFDSKQTATGMKVGSGCDLIQYIGRRFKNQEVYEGSIIRWMAEDGDCFKGMVEFTNDPPEGSPFLSGFWVTHIVDITAEVTDEQGELLPGWDGAPEVIGHILKNPELLSEKVRE